MILTSEQRVYLRRSARGIAAEGMRMRFPNYPSNREADEGTNATACFKREGVPEYEAKSGDLFTRECPWDGVKLCDSELQLCPLSPRGERFLFI